MHATIYHWEWIKNIEVNILTSTTQVAPTPTPVPIPTPSPACPTVPTETKDWEYYDCGPSSPYGKSWWLVDTHVVSPLWDSTLPNSSPVPSSTPSPIPPYYDSGAWDYSIGTGVKVAHVDRGFKTGYPNMAINGHPETKRRVKVSAEFKQGGDWDNTPANLDLSSGGGWHGQSCIEVGFGEKNNDLPTAGVAPNSLIFPYYAKSDVWDQETAFHNARENAKPNIISTSIASIEDYTWGFPILIGLCGYINLSCPSVPYYFHSWGLGYLSEINEALNAGIIVVLSAGNNYNNAKIPSDYRKLLHSENPNVIYVGAVQPTRPVGGVTLRQLDSSNGLPALKPSGDPKDLGLQVADFSNFGSDLIWAPGENIYISGPTLPSNATFFNGTSAATPFVAGTVALLKSRNPSLTAAQIKTILKNASTITVNAPNSAKNPNYNLPPGQVKMLDVEAALQNPLVNAKQAETYFAQIVEDAASPTGRSMRLNKFAQNSELSTDQKVKTISEQTISDEAWTCSGTSSLPFTNCLNKNAFVKVKGWSGTTESGVAKNIIAGSSNFNQSQIEISDFSLICNLSICNSSFSLPDWFHPEITSANQTNGNAASGFDLTLTGKDLIAQLQNGKETERFILRVQPIPASSASPGPTPTPTPIPDIQIPQDHILDIKNNGTGVKLKIDGGKIPFPSDYQIQLEGAGKPTPWFSMTGSGGGFGIQSVPPPVPHINLWLLRDGQRLAVQPGKVVGVAINDQDLSKLQVEIIQGDVHIQANVVEVAQNFASFQIPEAATPGVKDVLLKIDAKRLLLKDALEIPPSGPATVIWDKRDIYTNGNDWANLTIKNFRYPDGTPVPDGTPIMISVGDPYSTLVKFANDAPFNDGVVSPVNGEVKLKVASTRKIALTEYSNSDWPVPGNPAVTIPRICTVYYYNGYHCDQNLTPDSSQPPLYLKDAYSVKVTPENPVVEAGGNSVTVHVDVFDRAGLPVPDGTPIFGSGGIGGGGGWTGPPATTQNGIDFTYTSGPKSCYGQDGPLVDGMNLRSYYFDGGSYNFGSVFVTVPPYGRCPGY